MDLVHSIQTRTRTAFLWSMLKTWGKFSMALSTALSAGACNTVTCFRFESSGKEKGQI